MINEICHKLKEKRRELGYSIEHTVEKTKLHPSVIKDIENCDLSKIGLTYLRGFIKIYASFLGIEIGAALDELGSSSNLVKSHDKIKPIDRSSSFEKAVKAIKKVPPIVKKRIVIVLVGLILLWSFVSVTKAIVRGISTFFKARAEKSQQVKSKLSPSKVDKPVERVAKAIEGVEVSLTAKKMCYLRVIVDGNILFNGLLDKGAIESWRGDREIEFKISDGSAVSLEVNGKLIPTLTSIRKSIKSLKITPSGITVDK